MSKKLKIAQIASLAERMVKEYEDVYYKLIEKEGSRGKSVQ